MKDNSLKVWFYTSRTEFNAFLHHWYCWFWSVIRDTHDGNLLHFLCSRFRAHTYFVYLRERFICKFGHACSLSKQRWNDVWGIHDNFTIMLNRSLPLHCAYEVTELRSNCQNIFRLSFLGSALNIRQESWIQETVKKCFLCILSLILVSVNFWNDLSLLKAFGKHKNEYTDKNEQIWEISLNRSRTRCSSILDVKDQAIVAYISRNCPFISHTRKINK